MLKKYKELKPHQLCIYQAFSKAEPNLDPSSMADYVNSNNLNVDDDLAITLLAQKYHFNTVKICAGYEFIEGECYLSANTEVIAIITSDNTVQSLYQQFSTNIDHRQDDQNLAMEVYLNPQCRHVIWHAIYGVVDQNRQITWHDEQHIYASGPTYKTTVIFFSRPKKQSILN